MIEIFFSMVKNMFCELSNEGKELLNEEMFYWFWYGVDVLLKFYLL